MGHFIEDAVSQYSNALASDGLQMRKGKRKEVTLSPPKTPGEFGRSFRQINDCWYNRLKTFFTGRKAVTSIFNDPKYSSERNPLSENIALTEQGVQSLKGIKEAVCISEWAQAVAYAVLFEEIAGYYRAKGYSSSAKENRAVQTGERR